MDNKIIYHIGVRYDSELLSLLSATLPNYIVHNDLLRNFVVQKYGEHAVNLEALGVSLVANLSGTTDLKCDNLYTFMVLSGIVVPYQDWTYDSHYICQINSKAYTFDLRTGICHVEPFVQPLPTWASAKIYDLEGKLYLLRDQLRYESRERNRMEERFAHGRNPYLSRYKA